MTDLSIVIPSFRRPTGRTAEILELLHQIQNQVRPPSYEVLVIANPHDPLLANALNKFPAEFRYLYTDPIGANRARNRGVEAARGKIILFLDDDCRLNRLDFLRRHCEIHGKHQDDVAVGGRYILPMHTTACQRAYHLIQEHWLNSSRRQGKRISALLGGNVSFKVEVFKHCAFDEALIFGGTETELFARLEKDGYTCSLHDDIDIEHRPHLTVGRLIKKAFLQGVGRAYLERGGMSSIRLPIQVSRLPRRERSFIMVFECAFNAGYYFARKTGCWTASTVRVWREILLYNLRQLAHVPRNSFFTTLFFELRAALTTPVKPTNPTREQVKDSSRV